MPLPFVFAFVFQWGFEQIRDYRVDKAAQRTFVTKGVLVDVFLDTRKPSYDHFAFEYEVNGETFRRYQEESKDMSQRYGDSCVVNYLPESPHISFASFKFD